MKILRVIARLNVGGPARHVVWLTEGLKRAGCETILVAGTVPQGEDDMGYFADRLGVVPLIIPQMSRAISPKDALTTWKLFRLMLREKPKIVHTHTAKAGTVGRVAGFMYRWFTPGALAGKPRQCHFVHTYHGHVFHSYYGPLKTKLFLKIERLLARVATDRIVVVSEQQRREINEVFRVGRREQFAVIPLGIDLSAYADLQGRRSVLRNELGAAEDDVLVGIIGRLTEIKNYSLFLRAAAGCKQLISALDQPQPGVRRVRFVIIGDGGLRRALEAQARTLDLQDEVTFLGARDDPENFYAALDVVALTSLNEGTPLTLIEAMANRRPVIATAVGGVIDLVGQASSPIEPESAYTVCDRGVLVNSGDAEGLARGLARLVEDEPLRLELGRRGLDFVVRHHAKERLLRDMLSLYQELTGDLAGQAAMKYRAPVRVLPKEQPKG